MLHHDNAVRLFAALNAFPHLTTEDRARIANAAETNHQANWADAKLVRLDTDALRPFTLNQACGWAIRPTAEQILAGLHYAAGVFA